MKSIFLLFQFLSLAFACTNNEKIEAEINIINYLFKTQNYSSLNRPSFLVYISIELTLKQIISVDEITQVFITSSYLYLDWKDSRLYWSPSDFCNLERLPILAKNIWMPDLVILNGLETNNFLPITSSSIFWLNYKGEISATISLNGKALSQI